jgi:hypothetical protein
MEDLLIAADQMRLPNAQINRALDILRREADNHKRTLWQQSGSL